MIPRWYCGLTLHNCSFVIRATLPLSSPMNFPILKAQSSGSQDCSEHRAGEVLFSLLHQSIENQTCLCWFNKIFNYYIMINIFRFNRLSRIVGEWTNS